MVPAPLSARYAHFHSTRLLYTLLSALSQFVPRFFSHTTPDNNVSHEFIIKRDSKSFNPHDPKSIAFAVLIPVLVLLSGVFAGLTLGYMSLDETQLNVLSISGTPQQRKYANKIKPIRKNGHLLLVTLLLANMIVNESLPVIADPVLGGGFQGVVVSTVLIVIFAEIIPQSLFTRHGLYLGAKMAWFTKILIVVLGVIAWPVAKLLEFALGKHHGIIYRRAELKELIAMHSTQSTHGGDLKSDTVTIIGATLDLQEKVVKQAMTPIKDVFMLSIDSKLDYDLLKKICQTGHSRVPVYEEVDVPVSTLGWPHEKNERTQKMKKILGILLVKQCVLLDPKDATPLRKIPLNKVPFVPNNEPLLGLLDKFQEGRSHMAIVSRFSVEKAASVKKVVKRGLTQRLRQRVGMGDSDSSDEEKDVEGKRNSAPDSEELTLRDDGVWEKVFTPGARPSKKRGHKYKDPASRSNSMAYDAELGGLDEEQFEEKTEEGKKSVRTTFQLPKAAASMTSMSMLEQSMPADAVLAKEGAEEFLQNFDPAVEPLGIITLEDVLEELIGEEIYDEFDPQGAHGDPYEVPAAQGTEDMSKSIPATHLYMPTALKGIGGLGFLRSRSAPPIPRDPEPIEDTDEKPPHSPDAPDVAEDRAPDGGLNAPRPQLPVRPNPALTMSSPSARTASAGIPLHLEAVLLDRKRRRPSTPTGVASSASGTSTTALSVGAGKEVAIARNVPKGSKFKSSPLGDTE